jgi:hypothetical protein
MAVHLFANDSRNQFFADTGHIERWARDCNMRLVAQNEAQAQYEFTTDYNNQTHGLVVSKYEEAYEIIRQFVK